MSKTVIAKYTASGETFEILVDADKAYDYITGKIQDPLSALEVEDVFKDANKGDRQSQDKLRKVFNTEDLGKIAGIILKNGTVPLTTEQRNRLLEEKRRQVINIIATNAIDPRTNTPHTAQRIENAMKEAKVTIEPFRPATEQVDAVVKKLSALLPIKFSIARIEITIPAQYSNRCYSLLKQYGLKSEKWLNDGSLLVTVEFPAGLQSEFFDKLNNATKGAALTKMLNV